MTSYLKSTRDFLYNRRRPFIVVGGVVGGVYMVAKYAISKLTEVQLRMVEERRDRENLKRRFNQNQEDCNFTILALLPTLGDQLFSHMDVEGLTAKLQKGRQSPIGQGSVTPAVSKAAGVNGAVPAAVEESTMSSEQTQIQPDASSQQTMEEIWNKLGSTNDSQSKEVNGINGESSNGMASVEKADVVVANGDQGTKWGDQPQVDSPTITKENHAEEDALSNAATAPIANGLDSFSEPAPQPIPSTARLALSPSPTPKTQESEKSLEVDEIKPEQTEQPTTTSTTTTTTQEGVEDVPVPAHTNGTSSQEGTLVSESSPPVIQTQPKVPSPEEILAEKKEKLALWNELKITAFSRTLTTLYSLVLLSLQTHIQLNLLGRYAYLTSVASLSAPASSSNHHIRLERNDGQRYEPDEEDGMGNDDLDDAVKGIDLQTERLYLTFSWWFLHQGWKELADDVKAAVEDVLGGLALKTQLTHEDFLLLLNKIRRRVEYETKEDLASTVDARSEWSEATAATTRRRGKRKMFLSVLFPPSSEELTVLEKAGAIPHDPTIKTLSDLSPSLPTLLDETKDLLESKDFARILRLGLNRVFDVFEGTLRPTFRVEPALTSSGMDGLLRQSSSAAAAAAASSSSAMGVIGGDVIGGASRFQQLTDDGHAGIRVRLASLFPAVARQSSSAINGVPNEYVEALTDIKELKAFSAVIYSSWS